MPGDVASILVIVMSAQGDCVRANGAWLRATGQTHETTHGLGWLQAVNPSDVANILPRQTPSGTSPTPYRAEFRLQSKMGAYRWIALTVTPRRSKAGDVADYIATGVDITERKQAEEAVREALRRKDEFLATLSHELRNPLAAISSATDLLGLMEMEDPALGSVQEILKHQVEIMSRLVDDLLDVSRFMRGKITLQKTPLDLAQVVHRAVEAIHLSVRACVRRVVKPDGAV